VNAARSRTNWLLTIFVFVCALTVLFPLYLTVVTSLKSPGDMVHNLLGLPTRWEWGNFPEAVEVTDFPRALLNTAVLTVAVIVFTILTNSLVGYVIARNMHRGVAKFSYFYFLSALFVPFPIVMLPLVKLVSAWHLDNLVGLIVLNVVYNLSFNTLLYVGYLRTIPTELEEAASLDGAGFWSTYWRIIFPLMAPINATVAIIAGLTAWNDFLLPLIILSDQNDYTLPLVQYAFQGRFSVNYNLAFASYLMALAPMLLLYLGAQRWIIGGVVRGASR
jgi:raffinose/stachyose/melibiose transport system permease protein